MVAKVDTIIHVYTTYTNESKASFTNGGNAWFGKELRDISERVQKIFNDSRFKLGSSVDQIQHIFESGPSTKH